MLIMIGVGIVLALVGMALLRMIISYIYRGKFPFEVKGRLLSVDEQNFLKCLERALDDEYYIMPKVRFLEISRFTLPASTLLKRVVNRRIGNLCADFVLCKRSDLSILGVIELEKFDKLTSKKQKERREKMITSICRQMGVKIFYFDGRQDYTGMDIRRLITGRTRRINEQKVPAADPSMVSVAEHSFLENASTIEKVKSCPKCYSEVVTKVAVKGEHIGEKFLMCRKYPYCDYQVPLKDAVIKDMQRKEEVARKKAGYKNW